MQTAFQTAQHTLNALIGPRCTRTILEERRIPDRDCIQLILRKGLSVGIICGSAMVKLPQVAKILLSQSVAGLSLLAHLLETVATTITFAYNFRAGNPFITYGETLFITGQNALLVLLIGFYGRRMMQLLLITAVYSVFASSLLVPQYVSDDMMAFLQGATIPLAALARLPQILKIWGSRQSGQLSSLSLLLIMAGSWARLYTTLSEVHDHLLLIGFATSAILNTVLFLQVLLVKPSRGDKKKAE